MALTSASPSPVPSVEREASSRTNRCSTLSCCVAGMPGPWVTPQKYELIERFKFFHELAWKHVSPGKRLLQKLARYRCSNDFYQWPVEMLFTRWLVPAQKLS